MRAALRPIMARPLPAIGAASFAALFGCVALNALLAQTVRHSNPLLATRASAGAAAAAASGDAHDAGLSVPLVVEVQNALASAGYYSAPVDGRPGRATAAAIRAYQGDRGLPVDGEATPRLLASLRGERKREAAERQPAPDPSRVASLDPEPAIASDAPAPQAAGESDAPPRDLVRSIQERLAAARVAELAADGIMGSRTEAAIRTFQASRGLDVTGVPDRALLRRLEAVASPRR